MLTAARFTLTLLMISTHTSLLYLLGRKLGMDRRDAEEADALNLAEFAAGMFTGLALAAPRVGFKIARVLLAGLAKCALAAVLGLCVAVLLAVAKAAAGAAVWISNRYN